MRTTVTIEDDVAVQLDRLRREREIGFKEAINRALRIGLAQLERARHEKRAEPFSTPTIDLGPCLIGDISCTGTVLAIAEGEDYK